MATNVEITRGKSENNGSILKKFNRKVQESGILPRLRSIRYEQRPESAYTRKKNKLKKIERKSEIEKLIKLGKISDSPRRGRRR
jgi:ribosomal protein S21